MTANTTTATNVVIYTEGGEWFAAWSIDGERESGALRASTLEEAQDEAGAEWGVSTWTEGTDRADGSPVWRGR